MIHPTHFPTTQATAVVVVVVVLVVDVVVVEEVVVVSEGTAGISTTRTCGSTRSMRSVLTGWIGIETFTTGTPGGSVERVVGVAVVVVVGAAPRLDPCLSAEITAAMTTARTSIAPPTQKITSRNHFFFMASPLRRR